MIIIVFTSFSYALDVRINEVMPHKNNTYLDEWVEIYNNEEFEVNLTNYKICDLVGNDSINLTIPAKGLGLIVDSGININNKSGCSAFNIQDKSCFQLDTIASGLNDADESLFLKDNNSILISNFSWTSDIKTTGKSRSFNNKWEKCYPTPRKENNCTILTQTNETNNTEVVDTLDQPIINNTKTPSLLIENIDEIEDYLFKIKISAYYLENKYHDFKIYIEDKEKIISEIYDENSSKWISGNYYLNNFYVNENISKMFDIRLKEGYKNISGKFNLTVKIRENEKTNILLSNSKIIEIDANNNNLPEETLTIGSDLGEEINDKNESIIKLNSNEYPEEKTVYKSSNEKIKDNLLIGFCIFLIIIILRILK